MRDAAIARVRGIARARRAALVPLDPPSETELSGGDPRAADRITLPLILLPDRFTKLPECILIATDFSESSLCAARAALAVAPDAHVHLVHVCPSRWYGLPGEAHDGAHARLGEPFDALFAALEATLQAPNARFTRALLVGDPAEALLTHARARSVDLIALGVHGHASVRGKALGVVAERVLRGAQCGVLLAGVEAGRSRTTPGESGRRSIA